MTTTAFLILVIGGAITLAFIYAVMGMTRRNRAHILILLFAIALWILGGIIAVWLARNL